MWTASALLEQTTKVGHRPLLQSDDIHCALNNLLTDAFLEAAEDVRLNTHQLIRNLAILVKPFFGRQLSSPAFRKQASFHGQKVFAPCHFSHLSSPPLPAFLGLLY